MGGRGQGRQGNQQLILERRPEPAARPAKSTRNWPAARSTVPECANSAAGGSLLPLDFFRHAPPPPADRPIRHDQGSAHPRLVPIIRGSIAPRRVREITGTRSPEFDMETVKLKSPVKSRNHAGGWCAGSSLWC